MAYKCCKWSKRTKRTNLGQKSRKWAARRRSTSPFRIKFSYKGRRDTCSSTQIVLNTFAVTSAAAFIPCDGYNEERSHKMKQQNREDAGEDAFLISNIPKDTCNACISIGVADGVGGYAKYGIDSSETSWRLLENVQHFSSEDSCPKELLTKAYKKIIENTEVQYGGTTACVATIEKTASSLDLKVANLGDSGLLVIRGKTISYRTQDQLLGFNFPRQLSVPYKENSSCSSPADADKTDSICLQRGDIIVLGTDGLFDNIFDNEIVNIVNQTVNMCKVETDVDYQHLSQVIANKLASAAYKASIDKDVITPFEEHAIEWNQPFVGGKPDDITIVVTVVH